MQTLGHYPFKQRLIPRTPTNPHFNHKIVWGTLVTTNININCSILLKLLSQLKPKKSHVREMHHFTEVDSVQCALFYNN